MQEHQAYVGTDGDRDHRQGDHGTDLVTRGERGDPGGPGDRGGPGGKQGTGGSGILAGGDPSGPIGYGGLDVRGGPYGSGSPRRRPDSTGPLDSRGALSGLGSPGGFGSFGSPGGFGGRLTGPLPPRFTARTALPLPLPLPLPLTLPGVRALVVRVHSAPFGPDPSIRPPRRGRPRATLAAARRRWHANGTQDRPPAQPPMGRPQRGSRHIRRGTA
ncbi:hypothetical protein SLITK23_37360 [Streptomyces lividans]|nr:hypothetical protein SLITK23_37360 [Streptomyces lividans]